MPLFRFKCTSCDHEEHKFKPVSCTEIKCSKCEELSIRQLPKTVSSTIYETRDPHTGKQVRKNVESQLRSRSRKHHDKYEVAEKIDKHGMEDAERLGWTKKKK